MSNVEETADRLKALLIAHQPTLKITKDEPGTFEVCGTIPAPQGKKKVDGIYFASVMPKPRDVRFYYFPIYTHREAIGPLPEDLQTCLKGKSCFHIKQMDSALEEAIRELIDKGVRTYQAEGLLAE